jgi:hypothetical protein
LTLTLVAVLETYTPYVAEFAMTAFTRFTVEDEVGAIETPALVLFSVVTSVKVALALLVTEMPFDALDTVMRWNVGEPAVARIPDPLGEFTVMSVIVSVAMPE